MRLLSCAAILLSASQLITSATSRPQSPNPDLIARESSTELVAPAPPQLEPRSSFPPLWKRKGGGGGGKGSSSGGKSSGSSSGGGSSGGGSRSTSGGIGGGRTFSYSRSSNAGGRTRSGSGPPPGAGGYYAGGAKVPFAAGARSPSRGSVPLLLPIAAFAFLPGIWLYSSLYAYPFGYPYYYRNPAGQNQTVDVTCLCQQYSVCGCDDDGNSTYLQRLVGNGTDRPVNTSQAVVLPPLANGTQRAFINGTLPNGTTAPGGTDPSSDEQANSAAVRTLLNYGGYWIMLMTVVFTICAL